MTLTGRNGQQPPRLADSGDWRRATRTGAWRCETT